MRKSTIFISALLTTFMLAVLFGVASAYQNTIVSAQPLAAAQPQPDVVEVANRPAPTSAPAANITAEQAAALAAKVLGRADLYSVENAQPDGADTYLVTFSSGDLVYIGLDGQILSISKLPVTLINQPASTRGGGNNHASAQNSGGYEDDDHEDGEHEDQGD